MTFFNEIRYLLFGPPRGRRSWTIEEDPICGPTMNAANEMFKRLDPQYRNHEREEERRRRWFSDRLWHNGSHSNCCRRCFQAGYVVALLRCNRPELLREYPELIAVYGELQRDGMHMARQ